VATTIARRRRSAAIAERRRQRESPPVIGLTGTGGAGKSSLTDELLQRFLRQFPTVMLRWSPWIPLAAAQAAPC
jgi:putative protein kinase ArgK-like GTPase of G3E family